MYQSTFADIAQPKQKIDWANYVKTCTNDERAIIRGIMDLHNGGKAFDLDATYSIGRFWDGLPQPKLKFDLTATKRGMVGASATALPLASGSLHSIMFDPPFVCGIGNGGKPGTIRTRFSSFRNSSELWKFYSDALSEFFRVLRFDGMLTVKCQDTIDSGKQNLSHVHLINEAQRLGFYVKDLFVLFRESVIMSPNMERQYHARKNHCYFLVMVK